MATFTDTTWPPSSGGSWSLVKSLSGTATNLITDGTKLYYCKGQVIQVDPDNSYNETTLRENSANWPDESRITIFNDEIYACNSGTLSSVFEIWKWLGGTSWSKVYDGTGILDCNSKNIVTFNNGGTPTMICYGHNFATPGTQNAVSTTDGSSFTVLNHPSAIEGSTTDRVTPVTNLLPVVEFVRESDSISYVYTLSGSSWVLQIADTCFAGPTLLWSTGPYQYSQAIAPPSFTSSSDTNIEPLPTTGFTFGRQLGSKGTTTVYFWDDDALDWSATTDTGPSNASEVAILNDGRIFLVGGTGLYKRSVDILGFASGGSSEPCSFYYDINGLTQRSNLPVTSVPIRSTAIEPNSGLVAVPSGDAASYMVALGALEQLYAQWVDITYDIDQANGAKVLRWV